MTEKSIARKVLFGMIHDRATMICEGFKNRSQVHANVARGALILAAGLSIITESEMLDGINYMEKTATARRMASGRGLNGSDRHESEAISACWKFHAHFKAVA